MSQKNVYNFANCPLIHLCEVDSTNNYALKLLQTVDVIEGTMILTDFQTGGKGHYGSKWYSSLRQNVTASTILFPSWFDPMRLPTFNKAVALAVFETVSQYLDEDVSIKWPNDILVDRKKIAGILIENAFKGIYLAHSIIGIGINVNEPHFPDSLPNATSMRLTSGRVYDLTSIVTTLRSKLSFWYQQLYDNAFNDINVKYHDHLFGIDTWLNFRDASHRHFLGKIAEVDTRGKLIILDEKGDYLTFSHKEVSCIL